MHASQRSASFLLGAGFACALSLGVPGCAGSSDDASSAAGDQLSNETSYCASMEVSTLAASGSEPAHPPANVLDNHLTTRWVEQGVGAWLQADLGVAKTICGVGIAWYRGNLRTNAFQIRTSMDGVTFKTVFDARSSGARTTVENYDFPNVNARYVRLVVNENTETKYAAVSELRVRGVPIVRSETEPATGVTATSATLHGNFTWNSGDYGMHWFKYSDDGGSSWTNTPHVSWGPMPSAGSKAVAATVSGLRPSTRHVFLSCGTWRGSAAACRDSSGALGTDYDSFTTTRASLTYKGVQVELQGRPGTERPSPAQLRDANVGLVRVLNYGPDFSEGTSYINDIRANAGVEVCAELMQMSWSPGNLTTDAQWRARVTAFVQAIDVGPDGAYEIMNEPGASFNGGSGWNQVLHFMELAAAIIHERRPGSTVLLGAAMDVDQQSLLSAANARAGFWRFVDGFAIHPYGSGPTHVSQLGHTVARLNDARNKFKEYLSTHPSQPDLPMWITEMGWGVEGGANPALSGMVCQQGTGTLAQREVEQRDKLIEIYERLWPRRVKSDLYLKNIGWFHWHDYGNLDSWAEFCGLNRGRDETVALNDPSATIHTQRPSYLAFKAEPKSRSLP